MAKVIVIYESKYGNTKLVAEEIVEGIRKVEGIEVALSELKEVDLDKILDYHAILIGSPNHYGGPTKGVKAFIDRLGKLDLKGKLFAAFDTYLGKKSGYFFEKAVKKMEKRIKEKVPESKLLVHGLSIKVQGMKGPILEEEFPRCKEFGNKIAAQLET
ncbi:MAG: flavodoxin family protein [Candidatus Bathyarchaeota archaeon]|nr:flavodoxin family protein [Candidatus Bathyarchaeota archaeon]